MEALPGTRIADDGVYLSEDRRKQPKEYFKECAKILKQRHFKTGKTLLDIGCATAEFIDFLKPQFNDFKFIGLDISKNLISEASIRDPLNRYVVGDVRSPSILEPQCVDIITMFGVMDCFDELKSTFHNLMQWVRPGGCIIILDMINPEPIDTLTRYRRTSTTDSPWEAGWNLYSRQTINRELSVYPNIQSIHFSPFNISIDLPKHPEDPMRTWTIETENNPRQLVNGNCQMVNLEFITIEIK